MNKDELKKLEFFLENMEKKETLLLHSCCGPCSSYVLSYLNKYFDITIVYYNPNIHPKKEYEKRFNEQKKVIKEMFNNEIKIMECSYDPSDYFDKVKGYEKAKEGGKRCHICYELRMEEVARLAKKYNFSYFTTTLSVSPYKDSKILNEIGKKLSEKYKVNYLCSDFKKHDGYKKSIEYSKKYNLYRQNYCGCIYSLNIENKA